MNPIRFHPAAEAEMIAAVAYYEVQQENLGKRFLASVQDALNRIQVNPNRRMHASGAHDGSGQN